MAPGRKVTRFLLVLGFDIFAYVLQGRVEIEL